MPRSIESQRERELRILLVEDNPAHAELVIRSFENHEIGTRIDHVSDGEKALAFLQQAKSTSAPRASTSQLPDLILLDIRLPRIDGLEVLRRIRADAALAPIPTVILTTSADQRDVKRAYEFHANSYLVKPLEFDQFSRLMKELGFYWLEWNQRAHHLDDAN